MEQLRRGRARRLPRIVLGVAWRSSRTILGYAALGLVTFLVAALLLRRWDPPGWATAAYPIYVLAGALAGGYVGVLTALRRETQAIVGALTGHLGALTRRVLDQLALPSAGVEPARLRRIAEARLPVPGGRVPRLAANFAVARAVEAAGLSVLRERLLGLADDAERRGDRVVGRDAVEAVAREGVGVAVAARLTLGWTAARAVALGVACVLLLSLPVAVLLAD